MCCCTRWLFCKQKIKLLLLCIYMPPSPLLSSVTKYATLPPVPMFMQAFKIKYFTKELRENGSHHIISASAHGCSPECPPTNIWRETCFMRALQQCDINLFALTIWPTSKKAFTLWKAASFLLILLCFIYICICCLCWVII